MWRIQLADAMIALARTQPFLRPEVRRPRLRLRLEDRFLAANVSYALARADIAPGFRAEIKKILAEFNGRLGGYSQNPAPTPASVVEATELRAAAKRRDVPLAAVSNRKRVPPPQS